MFDKYIIKYDTNIVDAMKIINSMDSGDVFTLFVVDDNDSIIGSLTDGDIRRHIIYSRNLQAVVGNVCHRDIFSIRYNTNCVCEIIKAKNMGIKLIPILDENNKLVDVINLKKQKSFLPVDAVLMAGGKGERLRPLTEKTPKPLLKVGDRAIIDYNVERLISYGLKHISVTVNYLKEQIEEHFAMPKDGIKVDTVTEPAYLGTIGSVQFVKKFYNDTVLVMNSDLFTNIDYEDFYLHFVETNADMSIAAVPYSVSVPYGILDLDGKVVKGILEKPTYSYYANAGIYLIKREMLKLIPENTFFNATDFLNLLVGKNKKVVRFPLNGTWIDIGNKQEYCKVQELVKHIV